MITAPPIPALPNLWHVFRLRESPFFQDTLGSAGHPYPLSLFVGRAAETAQLLEGIGGARSSRQAIAGSAGTGKTTIVQLVKAKAIDAGYWAADQLIPIYDADTTESLMGRLLSGLYDTILALRPMTADSPAMQTAQQLVRVGRMSTGAGASVSVLGVGGGRATSSTVVTPPGAMLLDGPRIFANLVQLVQNAGARGVVLHMNNLENLTTEGTERAADMLRSLRDPILMVDGLHLLLVGTTDAIAAAVGRHAQVRSVFTAPITVPALPVADVQALLAARYAHLALPDATPTPPFTPATIAALYPLFRGDLRSFLNTLEEGVRLLVGVSALGASIGLEDLRNTLKTRYTARLRQQLDPTRARMLDAWGATPDAVQTQATLRSLWNVTQGTVSNRLIEFERDGYVLALPRVGLGAVQWVFTGMSRLIYG